MVIIRTLRQLKKYYPLVDDLFRRNGKIHFHSRQSIEASIVQNKSKDFCVVIDSRNLIITAFERKSPNVWQCSFSGFPFLTQQKITKNEIEHFLQTVKSRLNTNTLYFPLVYKSRRTLTLFPTNNIHCYDRLPSPIIEAPFNKKTIWERVEKRYGSRATRQRKKFENNLHTNIISKKDVKNDLSKVELNSWKRLYGQDMISRDNQIDYYNQLIKSGLARVAFAYNKLGAPIAFRIEAEAGNILYILKWSYDNNFKGYSPGFYLLTVDLFKIDKNIKYKYIDLFGSPDNLKSLIETKEMGRVDIYFSDDLIEVGQISKERLAYDTKIKDNYKNRKSIRKLFELD